MYIYIHKLGYCLFATLPRYICMQLLNKYYGQSRKIK